MTRAQMKGEAAWNVRQSLFTSRAQPLPLATAPTIAEILRGYRFSRYEYRTLYAGGVCTQAAMLVENPSDPNDRFIVTCRIDGGGVQTWECQCPAFRKDEGVNFIEAVKARIESQRSAKAVN
jgi:hypothetical protein